MGGVRKRGGSGRGSRLDPETSAYFRKVLETLREGLSPEEMALFTPNVLSEVLLSDPIQVSQDPWGSRLLQALLPKAPLEILGWLLPDLGRGGLEGPPGHPLGARVLESSLGEVLGVLEGSGGDFGAFGGVLGALEELGEEVLGDLVGFAQHPPSSFVLRALLRVLGGIPQKEAEPKPKGAWPSRTEAEPAQKGAEPAQKGAELPPSFPLLLQRLAEEFEANLSSLLTPPCANLCLQGALQALSRSQSGACARLCRSLIGRLAPEGPAPSGSSPLALALGDPARGRLLEAAMTVAGPEELRGLFRQLKGHLVGVANHPLANHGLQRFLEHAPPDLVGEVLEELGPALSQPLARGHVGVLTAMMAACRRDPPSQQGALRFLFRAFGCWDPPERRRLCLRALGGLRPLGEGDTEQLFSQDPLPLTPGGSRLLQHLLNFGENRWILESLGALPLPPLLSLSLSPPGSHLWAQLLGSPRVPPRSKRRLVKRLRGHLPLLSRSRSGRRVLDAIAQNLAPRSSPGGFWESSWRTRDPPWRTETPEP